MEAIVTKICSRCKEEKPICDFNRDRNRYRSECKLCRGKYTHRFWRENKERLQKFHRKYYEEHREKKIQQAKAWYENNKEKRTEICKRWRAANIEKHRESCRKSTAKYTKAHPDHKRNWIARNPYKGRQYNQKRKARLLEVGGVITAEEWEALLDFYGRKCLCCGRTEEEVDLHLDHVVPVSKGGVNVIENAQPLCKSCNSSKHDKTIDYRKQHA